MEVLGDRADGAAVGHWLAIRDQLLRGVTHTLSNRLATASAAVSLVELGRTAPTEAGGVFRAEVDRLEEVLHLLRQLPHHVGAAGEPLVPAEVVQAALRLHGHYPDLRDVPCTVRSEAGAPPGWGDPEAVRHAVVVALTSAKRTAGASGVQVVIDGGDADVLIRVQGGPPDAETALAVRTIDWLLTPNGGGGALEGTAVHIRLPSLAAARRRA